MVVAFRLDGKLYELYIIYNILEMSLPNPSSSVKPPDAEIDDMIEVIMKQTDYTDTEAYAQLELFEFNYIDVIKQYLGIDVRGNREKDTRVSSTVNQEIFKQYRRKLNASMSDYTKRVEAKKQLDSADSKCA